MRASRNTSNFRNYKWLGLALVLGPLIVALIFAAAEASSGREIAAATAAGLTALAPLGFGSLVGFLFGIPRTLTGDMAPPITVHRMRLPRSLRSELDATMKSYFLLARQAGRVIKQILDEGTPLPNRVLTKGDDEPIKVSELSGPPSAPPQRLVSSTSANRPS